MLHEGHTVPISSSNENGPDREYRQRMLFKYYDQHFPAEILTKWLSGDIDDKQFLCQREFSFTLGNGIYSRFQSFDSSAALKMKLRREIPEKVDIGPVYNVRPNERKSLLGKNMKAIQHELVFDIDMTDYDDVRTCCQGKRICAKCWKFIALAVTILDESLKEDFGFRRIMWVFSGRRGVHGWVFDQSARKLNHMERKAIISYLDLAKDFMNKQDTTRSLLSTKIFRRTNALLEKAFFDIMIRDQGYLSTIESRDQFLKTLRNAEIKDGLMHIWSESRYQSLKGEDYWDSFATLLSKLLTQEATLTLLAEIYVKALFPRLDVNVSTHMNHLLKCPFSVHPDTGKISLPLEANSVNSFNPEQVPTIQQVVEEEPEAISSFQKSLELFRSVIES